MVLTLTKMIRINEAENVKNGNLMIQGGDLPTKMFNQRALHMKPRLKIPHIVHIDIMGKYIIVEHPKNFRCECEHNCYIQYNEHSPLFLFRGVDELNSIMTVC